MNKELLRKMGFGGAVDRFEAGKCPICNKDIDKETEFKDDLSRKEYEISGMCQTCQDGVFSQPSFYDDLEDAMHSLAPKETPQNVARAYSAGSYRNEVTTCAECCDSEKRTARLGDKQWFCKDCLESALQTLGQTEEKVAVHCLGCDVLLGEMPTDAASDKPIFCTPECAKEHDYTETEHYTYLPL